MRRGDQTHLQLLMGEAPSRTPLLLVAEGLSVHNGPQRASCGPRESLDCLGVTSCKEAKTVCNVDKDERQQELARISRCVVAQMVDCVAQDDSGSNLKAARRYSERDIGKGAMCIVIFPSHKTILHPVPTCTQVQQHKREFRATAGAIGSKKQRIRLLDNTRLCETGMQNSPVAAALPCIGSCC
jgi:hypothetical protein